MGAVSFDERQHRPPQIDKEAVKARSRGNVAPCVLSLTGIDLLQYTKEGPCLTCGGVTRMRYDAVKEFLICSKCGGCGDVFSIIMRLRGLGNERFPAVVREVAEYFGMSPIGDTNNCSQADPLDLLAQQKGVPRQALEAFGAVVNGKSVVFPTWSETGERLGDFTITPTGTDKQKKGLFAKGSKAGLFLLVVNGKPRLPQAGEVVHLVEGVKDAAALHALGFLAVGLNTCKMNRRFARMFRGCVVVVVPDRDQAGEDGAIATAAILHGIATSVKIAALPMPFSESGGADVRDCLKLEGGEALVRETIGAAVEWKPAGPPDLLPGEISLWKDEHRTDLYNGKRLAKSHGQRSRYCDTWGSWLLFNGQRWQEDRAGCHIAACAKDVPNSLWKEYRDAELRLTGDEEGEKLLGAMYGFVRSTSTAGGIRNMIDLCRSEVGMAISHEQLDADPWAFNVANGTLDLRTGKLRPHDPADFLSKQSPVVFDAAAACPRWLEFLHGVTCKRAELADYLRRLAGYSLVGVTSEHILAFLYGDGANGKSTFTETVMAMMGKDYAMRSAPELLMEKGDAHPTERADLHGKRLVTTNEIGAGRSLNEALVKDLTGGDKIRARRMREDFWEFTATHTVWMAGNHKPRIKGTDNGIWRRLKLIPFDRKFSEEEQDKSLPAKLLAELPGILNWALQGCLEWQKSGLGEPEAVTKATAAYRDEQDVIGAFLAERCIVGANCRVKAGFLFAEFKQWAESAGERPMSVRTFGEEMVRRFEKQLSNGKWYIGVGVKEGEMGEPGEGETEF